MPASKIVAIVLIHNEDLFIERVLRNIREFCDEIVVADHHSTDRTADIARRLSQGNPAIRYQLIRDARESHPLIEEYAGTSTWIFGVDGDEVYDPAGLRILRQRLLAGDYDRWWMIYGNVLNCVGLSADQKTAEGYLSPPSRSMTKLYNFQAISSWTDCVERLHGDNIMFRVGWNVDQRYSLHQEVSWDKSCFRCLHTCFLRRSSLESETMDLNPRLNLVELSQGGPLDRIKRMIRKVIGKGSPSQYKLEKYRKGPLVQKDVRSFFSE